MLCAIGYYRGINKFSKPFLEYSWTVKIKKSIPLIYFIPIFFSTVNNKSIQFFNLLGFVTTLKQRKI